MEKDLVDIVMEKKYIELSEQERKSLSEYCNSEAEYDQMREVFLGVEMLKVAPPTPKAETKKSLDDLFDQTYPRVAPVWYMSVLTAVVPKDKPVYRQPLLQIAAVGLLLLLVYPLFNYKVDEPVQMAEVSVPKEDKVVPALEKENEVKEEESKEFRFGGMVSPVVEGENEEELRSAMAEVEELETTVPASTGFAFSAPGSTHPDGVFIGNASAASEEIDLALSQPASEEPELFDLLTAAF
jgi:hypothetical protein